MPKVKIPRKSTNIDMTAMCDVAFLLLTFFMLTTKFKSDDPVIVDLPSSVSQYKLPDANVVITTIDKQGKVFFGMDGKFLRQQLLLKMGQQYKVEFTTEETNLFGLISSFGVPMKAMKTFLSMSQEERNMPENQPGIPTDSTNNELKDWLRFSKIVVAETNMNLYRSQLFAVRGDGTADYPKVKNVMNTLQDLSINKFRLITNLEAMPTK